LGELLEPLHHGAIAGDTGQHAEPREQRIAGDVPQVLEPPCADHLQRDHQHQVGSRSRLLAVLTEASAETLGQTDELKVAAQQLQLAVGSKLFTTKLKIRLTTRPSHLQPHLWRLPCRVELREPCTLYIVRGVLIFNQSISTGKNFLL
jgi:hypothetical protein